MTPEERNRMISDALKRLPDLTPEAKLANKLDETHRRCQRHIAQELREYRCIRHPDAMQRAVAEEYHAELKHYSEGELRSALACLFAVEAVKAAQAL